MYLAIDPGDTTGFALFKNTGELDSMGQLPEAEFHKWLDKLLQPNDIALVIIEDYKVLPSKASSHYFKRNKTSEKIGSVETICKMRGIKILRQPASIKSIGYMWAHIPVPSNHKISHQYDAYVHGYYYLQKNGIIKPSLESRIKNEERDS